MRTAWANCCTPTSGGPRTTGESFDRASYLRSNAPGRTTWRGQDLGDPEVLVVGDAAVLRTVVTDTIDRVDGIETYRMPMTQFWVRTGSGWLARPATPDRD